MKEIDTEKMIWRGGCGWFKDKNGNIWQIIKTPYKKIPIVEVNFSNNENNKT